jgi:hypothetical protein
VQVTTLEYLPVLDLADVLFARKFDPAIDAQVLDAIDELRSVNKLPGAVPSTAALALAAASSGSLGGSVGSADADDDCSDAHAACRSWAALGECGKNPAYMRVSCAYSCGSCPAKEPPAQSSAVSAAEGSSLEAASAVRAWRKAKAPNFLGGVAVALAAAPGALPAPPGSSGSDSDSSRPAAGWEGLLCVEMAPHRGARTTLQPCAPEASQLQRVDFGPCSQDGTLRLDEVNHSVVSVKGTFAAPFCLAQVAQATGKACFDVEKEQVKTGAKLISWPCHKTKWNQLFSFLAAEAPPVTALELPSSPPPHAPLGGSLYINIPFAHHRDKHMCVTAAALQPGAELELSPCRPDDPKQRFTFHRASAPPGLGGLGLGEAVATVAAVRPQPE